MAASNEVTLQELHDHTADVLKRVEAGERLTIVVDGKPVGELGPPRRHVEGTPRDVYFPVLFKADRDLLSDLHEAQKHDTTESWVDPWAK